MHVRVEQLITVRRRCNACLYSACQGACSSAHVWLMQMGILPLSARSASDGSEQAGSGACSSTAPGQLRRTISAVAHRRQHGHSGGEPSSSGGSLSLMQAFHPDTAANSSLSCISLHGVRGQVADWRLPAHMLRDDASAAISAHTAAA